MVEFDTGRMRGMAGDHRGHADAVEALTPVAGEEVKLVRPKMKKSVFAVRIEECLTAMDGVTDLHGKRLRSFADLIDGAAAEADQMDDDNAVKFGG
ncbi:hypothetical protein ACFV4K_01055 [Nocardia sp. NPDC059764]|uniref:hypothetical protein n=1 Tax=Nocardia sp. NPDC059764 TaxID=3346939 RepID=UPI003655E8F7